MDYYGKEPSSDFFAHYGIKGMKWGVRKRNKVLDKIAKSITGNGAKANRTTNVTINNPQITVNKTKNKTVNKDRGNYRIVKKYERKAKRAKIWVDSYKDAINELKNQNSHTDIFEKRNNKYINKWNKKLDKHNARLANYNTIIAQNKSRR